MTKLDEYYHSQKEPLAGCLMALRQLILNYDRNVTEKWYYRLPCFMYANKLMCYVWVDRATNNPYIAFYPEKKLMHPLLTQGNRTHSKTLRIDPLKDIPIAVIYEILDEVKEKQQWL